MTERYTNIPEQQKMMRSVPEAGQARATGGAFGRENRRQNAEAPQNPFSAHREQTRSARENIHNLYTDRQQWLRSSRQGTLAEIRDLLRQQAILRELDEIASVRASVHEKINRKREETLAGTQEGEEKLPVGKWFLSLLAAMLSTPLAVTEQTLAETKQQAEQAA